MGPRPGLQESARQGGGKGELGATTYLGMHRIPVSGLFVSSVRAGYRMWYNGFWAGYPLIEKGGISGNFAAGSFLTEVRNFLPLENANIKLFVMKI